MLGPLYPRGVRQHRFRNDRSLVGLLLGACLLDREDDESY